MLWNWYTVDACFLSSTWHITSPGMFAGSCIGVICLVMSLEFLRRLTKEYDRYLIYKHAGSHGATKKTSNQPSPSSSIHSTLRDAAGPGSGVFRPTIIEQTIRALLHMLQFAVAYFIMLYVPTLQVLMPTTGYWLMAALHQKACNVLQRLHHHLYLHRCLSRCIRLPVGDSWTTVSLQ